MDLHGSEEHQSLFTELTIDIGLYLWCGRVKTNKPKPMPLVFAHATVTWVALSHCVIVYLIKEVTIT